MKNEFERRFIVTELVWCETCHGNGHVLVGSKIEYCPSCCGQRYVRHEVNMHDAVEYIIMKIEKK